MKRLHLFFGIMLLASWGVAQGPFDIVTEVFEAGPTFSGSPLAVADMNNDYLDDLIFLEGGTELYIGYQDPFSHHFVKRRVGSTNKDPQWAVVIFDADRNGQRDIAIGGAYDQLKIYYQEGDSFRVERHAAIDVYCQAMNAIDIDNDGWTDIFQCNDRGQNVLWRNRQGRFQRDTTQLLRDLPPTLARGNYGSEWGDVDGDGDLDLYVAKCFASSNLPTDPERVNRLYIQQEDGSFVNEAELRGVASGAQSWTGHLFDMDNDGDLDILVTNHDVVAELYENDGRGYYTERTFRSQLAIVGLVIQSLAFDINADGWQDVIISGAPDDFYFKDGPGGYVRSGGRPLGLYNLTSMAVGDLNNDMRYDLWANLGQLINLTSQLPDRILLNNQQSGHGYKVYLCGTESNPDGIGAKIWVYNEGEVRLHQVKAGESYGVQNTYGHLFFSAPEDENGIDSIRVVWPSGRAQTVQKPAPDHYLLFWEGRRVVQQADFYAPTEAEICSGDSLWIEGPVGFEVKINGQVVPGGLWVRTPGYYDMEICDSLWGCLRLPGIVVRQDVVPQIDLQFVSGDSVVCDGARVELAVEGQYESLVWADGDTHALKEIMVGGRLPFRVRGKCVEREYPGQNVEFVVPEFELLVNDTVKKFEDALLIARNDDGNTEWYRHGQPMPFWDEDSLNVLALERDTFFEVVADERYNFPVRTLGKSGVDATGSAYHDDALNGTMIFEVDRPVIFESVEVWTDFPGRRAIQIRDKNLKVVHEVVVDLDGGASKILLNHRLDPLYNPYRITTNQDTNMVTFGVRSPRLMSCDSNVRYPYEIPGLMRIINAQYGYDVYNYFYQWKVRPESVHCYSRSDTVVAVIDRSTSTVRADEEALKVYPNPSGGSFMVKGEGLKETPTIYDVVGRKVDSVKWKKEGEDYRGYLIRKGWYVVHYGLKRGLILIQ